MNQKDGLINQNTPGCIGLGSVRTGGITSDVAPGSLATGVGEG